MKKVKMMIAVTAMGAVLITQSGCFGKFALSHKVFDFNNQVSSDKFVKSVVMWAFFIIPIYEVACAADLFILNVMEFWTGSNPLAMQEGQKEQQIVERNGEKFQITATKNKFHVEQLSGKEAGNAIDYVFNAEESAWYLQSNGQTTKIIQYSSNGKEIMAQFIAPNGKSIVTNLDKATQASAYVAR